MQNQCRKNEKKCANTFTLKQFISNSHCDYEYDDDNCDNDDAGKSEKLLQRIHNEAFTLLDMFKMFSYDELNSWQKSINCKSLKI